MIRNSNLMLHLVERDVKFFWVRFFVGLAWSEIEKHLTFCFIRDSWENQRIRL